MKIKDEMLSILVTNWDVNTTTIKLFDFFLSKVKYNIKRACCNSHQCIYFLIATDLLDNSDSFVSQCILQNMSNYWENIFLGWGEKSSANIIHILILFNY